MMQAALRADFSAFLAAGFGFRDLTAFAAENLARVARIQLAAQFRAGMQPTLLALGVGRVASVLGRREFVTAVAAILQRNRHRGGVFRMGVAGMIVVMIMRVGDRCIRRRRRSATADIHRLGTAPHN